MAQFEPLKDELQQAGAQVVYIAAEKREGVWKPGEYLADNPISFPFLLDEDRSVTKAYGLYHRIGTDAINIAHPATLVLNEQGVIQFIYRGMDQHDRIPVAAIMEVVKKSTK
jgi:peroxiredoxin